MYRIQKTDYGFNLLFSGEIDAAEMEKWIKDSEQAIKTQPMRKFGVIVDMKDLKPLKLDVSIIMRRGQTLYKNKGMQRSAVLLRGERLTTQFKNIAIQSGIYNHERYLNVDLVKDYEGKAIDWVENGVDPDKL